MSERKLKPCPFCGGEAEVRTKILELVTKDVPIESYVTCTKCFASTSGFSYKDADRKGIVPAEEAAKAWNRRIEAEGSEK